MKSMNLKMRAEANRGEYVFGSADTGSHACYMIYGTLRPGEKGREIRPGKGHEEMVLAAQGSFSITGDVSGTLDEGFVFHIAGEHACCLENKGEAEAVYIIAGGHSDHEHHH
jgi:hypothetical protein